jgi:acyl carrier protein
MHAILRSGGHCWLIRSWHQGERPPVADIWGTSVTDDTNPELNERVAALVRALLVKRSIDRLVGRDDDLGESGLSSLDLVNLMLAVEAEFDLSIPEGDMRPANFRSIARIEALIGALRSAREPVEGN